MMIGKGAGSDDAGAHRLQRVKEFFRPADPRHREHRTSGKAVRRGRMQRRMYDRATEGRKREGALAKQHDSIRAREALLDGLAKRACGNEPAVAKAHRGVDHDERQVLGKLEILEAVVHHDHARAELIRKLSAARAVVRNDRGRHGRQQQRFVTDVMRVVPRGMDNDGPAQTAAIAACQERNLVLTRGQYARERDRDGGFPRTSGGEIADAQNMRFTAERVRVQLPRADGSAIERAQRCEQSRREAIAVPEIRRTHGVRAKPPRRRQFVSARPHSVRCRLRSLSELLRQCPIINEAREHRMQILGRSNQSLALRREQHAERLVEIVRVRARDDGACPAAPVRAGSGRHAE